MDKILTAEEKLKANFYNGSFIEVHSGDFEDIKTLMIEFAKLHVQAALETAANTKIIGAYTVTRYERDGDDKSFILNAYPLENIK